MGQWPAHARRQRPGNRVPAPAALSAARSSILKNRISPPSLAGYRALDTHAYGHALMYHQC
jgi:hypothetical protein